MMTKVFDLLRSLGWYLINFIYKPILKIFNYRIFRKINNLNKKINYEFNYKKYNDYMLNEFIDKVEEE